MVNLEIMKSIKICVKVLEKFYPNTKKYNVDLIWADSEEFAKKKLAGEIITYKDSNDIDIKLNALRDFLDILDTIHHEFAHLVQHSENKKMNHNKYFNKVYNKIKKEWVVEMLKK